MKPFQIWYYYSLLNPRQTETAEKLIMPHPEKKGISFAISFEKKKKKQDERRSGSLFNGKAARV